jgi:hypothetical protein
MTYIPRSDVASLELVLHHCRRGRAVSGNYGLGPGLVGLGNHSQLCGLDYGLGLYALDPPSIARLYLSEYEPRRSQL